MLTSFETSVIAVAACLVFGFPVAYFLAMKVEKLQNQIALFIIALAPFWTSFLTRSVAWAYPLMGREGALNQALLKLHIVSQPVDAFGFSTLSVRLAMIQLYILFMITPIFFLLAQVDRHALEAARDLGGNWFSIFREVILPQTMPGIVIGSIFIFVLTMGEYGTVAGHRPGCRLLRRHLHPAADRRHPVPAGRGVGGAARPRADPRRVRDHPRGQPAGGALGGDRRRGRDPGRGPPRGSAPTSQAPPRLVRSGASALYFVVFLVFLYAPMILMAILSFQGYYGGVTFPFKGPVGLNWWRSIFENAGRRRLHARLRDPGGRQALALAQPGRGRRRRLHGVHALDGLPAPLPRRRARLLPDPARADGARLPARSRHAALLEGDGRADVALADGARHEHRLGHPLRVPRHGRRLEPLRRPHRRGGARPRRRRGEDVPGGDAARSSGRASSARSCSASRSPGTTSTGPSCSCSTTRCRSRSSA